MVVKKILEFYYKEGNFYRVLFGKLRGLQFCYRKDVNFREMLGFWESDSLNVLVKLFDSFRLREKKLVVADVGANLGFYSMFFASQLHADTSIFAFEPSTSIVGLLRKNISKNNFSNVQIEELACSDKPGQLEFFLGINHHQSSISKEWAANDAADARVMVNATSLDDFFIGKGQDMIPDLIKMDIEGGGVYALVGCEKCIEAKRPFILIESHTAAEDMAISKVLLDFEYEAYRVNTKKWVSNKSADYTNPEGVWGTMLMIPSERKLSLKI